MRHAIWVLWLLSAGCGHPASVRDCEIIVERITELEIAKNAALKGSKSLAEEVLHTKQSLRDETMKNCVGRRITNRAMRCVREATSSKQIVDECFD